MGNMGKNDGHICKAKIVCQTKQDILDEKARQEQEILEEKARKRTVAEKSSKQVLKDAICSAFEKPRFMKVIGPKHVKICRDFLPSMVVFTAAGALCTVYLCDWKHVLQYVPLWRGKYTDK